MADGVEIERKFLVAQVPGDLEANPSYELEQGYIAITNEGVEVRVRHREGAQALLTIKSGGGQERLEEEIEIDDRRFRALWPLTDGRRIRKRRYLIPIGDGLHIELDVYRGELDGLRTAEIEFDSADAARAFTPPSWFGPEVTDDPRYKNKRLATDGLPA